MDPSSKLHTPGPRKGSTRQTIKQQHATYYRLWLMGWSESQIAETYSVNQSTVSRAVDKLRHGGTWADKAARDRFKGLIQEAYDATRLTLSEAWGLYHDQRNRENPELRSNLLARIQAAIGLLTRLLPDEQSLAWEDQIQELKQAMVEGREARKIIRLVED